MVVLLVVLARGAAIMVVSKGPVGGNTAMREDAVC